MINIPLKKPELFSYTPHQSRMLLIDRVDNFSIDNGILSSSLIINESSEFFNKDKEYVPIWVSFEYMAQSIATLSGIAQRMISNDPKIGFIIGIRDFKSFNIGFKVGNEVNINIKETYRENNIAVFEGKTYVGSKLYSSASLNVVESNQDILDKWK